MLTELTPEVMGSMLVNQYFGRIACAADGQVLIQPMMYYYDGHTLLGLIRLYDRVTNRCGGGTGTDLGLPAFFAFDLYGGCLIVEFNARENSHRQESTVVNDQAFF